MHIVEVIRRVVVLVTYNRFQQPRMAGITVPMEGIKSKDDLPS